MKIKPIKFKEATIHLTKPDSMTERECGDLWVFNDSDMCVSCWKVPFFYRIRLLFSGNIWLSIMSGRTQPPVKLDVIKPIEYNP